MSEKLVYIVTHPNAAVFLLRGQLKYMREQGFDVYLIVAHNEEIPEVQAREGVKVIEIPFRREIDLLHDFRALTQLTFTLARIRPDIVNASTPKAGFFGMLAAWATRVPVRIYLLRGLRLETEKGLKRKILSVTERVASACADHVVCISESLRRNYVDLGFTKESKTTVFLSGSSNGIDVERFSPSPEKLEVANQLREEMGLDPERPTVGFIGRLTRDKGVVDLLEAFGIIQKKLKGVQLLLVGGFEEGDPIPEKWLKVIDEDPDIYCLGLVKDPVPYYLMMDVFAFGSKREGFGNVLVEASSAQLPIVAYRTTGVVDAVNDGVSGTLVELENVEDFAGAILTYLTDDDLREKHSKDGYIWAKESFQKERLWEVWADEYRNRLQKANKGVFRRIRKGITKWLP